MECTYRPTKAEEDVLVQLATIEGLRTDGGANPLQFLPATVARVFQAGLDALQRSEELHLRRGVLLAVFRDAEGVGILSAGVGSTKDAERLWNDYRPQSKASALDVYRLDVSEDGVLQVDRVVRFGPG